MASLKNDIIQSESIEHDGKGAGDLQSLSLVLVFNFNFRIFKYSQV